MNYSRVLDEIFSQFNGPAFSVKLWDGEARQYGTGTSPSFTLYVRDASTAQRLLGEGSLGFGEAYMKGDIRIEGDLEAYLRLRHQFKRVRRSLRLVLATFLARRNTSRRKDEIAYHYDLGNDFFRMILDNETMSYSAGRYENGTEDLVTAQKKKLELACDWLKLQSGASVLDLGSGWGGFAEYAATHFNWQVTGYSLSNAQLDYCRERAHAKKLEGRVSFEDRDMTADVPATEFDGIVMIESIEHVGKRQLAPFIAGIKQSLKPGGSFYIQTTGRYQPRPVDRWTLKYVFPGGYLPAKGELLEAASGAGLIVEEFRDDTPDYIRTMTEWTCNLESHRTEIESMHGQSFYRLWELWMHGAKVAFEINSMNLFRIRLRRPH
ncbi:hypothetical protein A2704_06490 [Candidatus Kaiserbacteria bacterium RIFCSPHIGHO2_01_FULL_54_36b]|uniref:DUF7884 domain-containing protein n=1 Tax=Candidatus Kaiserbacteria bacterium RIFCSPHIGHO2_01_FULL_54_36b TaxID=1798483 RepID=A0A1F6CNW1_9BACT|nr:MAG: hypothetical protein A2704_06490 [Candidatus Kaiserbacteria bacterium RIFCSPHIGHO2_01_FULL_54_36b]